MMANHNKKMDTHGESGCCSKKCWVIFGVLAFILLLLASGGIAGLVMKLVELWQEPLDLVDTVRACAECPRCYACLGGFTGQDVEGLCDVKDLGIVVQCTSQIYFLYSKERANPSTPCYKECTRCRKCIEDAARYSAPLTETLWESVYTDYLVNQSEIDSTGRCNVSCGYGDTASCRWDCPITQTRNASTGSGVTRRRRDGHFEADMDLCCDTRRSTEAYLDAWTDPSNGVPWYPVWLYKSWLNPPYSVQVYDDVRCESPNLCNPAWGCRKHAEPRSILMSSIPPGSEGYTRIVLTYPNRYVKFITLPLPCYCRCSDGNA